jgi:hypothetical protein
LAGSQQKVEARLDPNMICLEMNAWKFRFIFLIFQLVGNEFEFSELERKL